MPNTACYKKGNVFPDSKAGCFPESKMLGIKLSLVSKKELLEAIESDGRESYLRAIVSNQNGGWIARLTGHQGSGNLRSLVQANALLLVPSGVKSLPIGAKVTAWLLDSQLV